jgi:hypothetical protein
LLVSDVVVKVMLTVVRVSVLVVLAVVLVWVTVDSVTELDEDVTTLVLVTAADVVLLVDGFWADIDDLFSAFRVLVVVEILAIPVDALVTVEVVLAVPPACAVVLLFGVFFCAGPLVELGGNVATLVLEAVTDVVLLVVSSWAGLDDLGWAFCVLVVVERLAFPVDALVTVEVVLNVVLARVVLLLADAFFCACRVVEVVFTVDAMVDVEVVLNVVLARVVLLLADAFLCACRFVEVDESAAEVVSEVVLGELREEVRRADVDAAGASVVLVREAVVGTSGSLVAVSCSTASVRFASPRLPQPRWWYSQHHSCF